MLASLVPKEKAASALAIMFTGLIVALGVIAIIGSLLHVPKNPVGAGLLAMVTAHSTGM